MTLQSKNYSTSILLRMRLLYIVIFLSSFILIARLFTVQVVNGSEYTMKANGQYTISSSGIFNRGNIFFTKRDGGYISAATLKNGFVVAINPSRLKNPKEAFVLLSEFLDIDSGVFFIKASKKDDPYEEIARRVPDDTANKIQELGIDGVIISKDRWRFYPGESMASHILGFVGYNGNILSGRYGLERYYDDVLSRSEEDLYVNFFAKVFSSIGDSIFKKTHREGDIVTSIETSVQSFLEDKLNEISVKWDADSVGGVIINPRTGSIYAMASLPTFNPNKFNTTSGSSVFQNPIVESVFEMGSIIKPITLAIGLDSDAIKTSTEYVDNGYVLMDGRRIENFDGKARGKVSMQEILNQSLNTGAVFVMQKTGKDKFKEYVLNLGLGEETGIDLPNEVSGLIKNLSSKRDIEYATASFGQGIAITPIATVRALSALANGGTLVTPHIGTKIDYRIGLSSDIATIDSKRVFKKETSEDITRMLVSVVDDALSNGKAKITNYSVAAKTGTAQRAKPEGGYYDDEFLHSFFGYFPAYDPEFLVFLYTVNPKNIQYASQTLTNPFMDITKFLLNYYDILPDR